MDLAFLGVSLIIQIVSSFAHPNWFVTFTGTSTPSFGQTPAAAAGPIPFGSPSTPVQAFNAVPFGRS